DPGAGVHLTNMLGEQDVTPLGFHRHPTGRRMPSMIAPTTVVRDGQAELAVGSAGSNRIRSAILQTILRSIDDGLPAQEAVDAPRLHYEDGIVYTEPGIDLVALEATGRRLGPFRDRNLFFGGVQAAAREDGGGFSGGGDPRRGTVFSYRISLQQGTIRFSDRDAKGHRELARAELFAVQAAQQACGLSG